MSEKTEKFVKDGLAEFCSLISCKFLRFMLRFQYDDLWPNNWSKHKAEFLDILEERYHEAVKKITPSKLFLVCFGAAAFKTDDDLLIFWKKHFKKHPIILSIFTFLLSNENWKYLQCTIPNDLTLNEKLASKQRCLNKFLQDIAPGTLPWVHIPESNKNIKAETLQPKDFNVYENRLESFYFCRYLDKTPPPPVLAENGFMFLPERNKIICSCCGSIPSAAILEEMSAQLCLSGYHTPTCKWYSAKSSTLSSKASSLSSNQSMPKFLGESLESEFTSSHDAKPCRSSTVLEKSGSLPIARNLERKTPQPCLPASNFGDLADHLSNEINGSGAISSSNSYAFLPISSSHGKNLSKSFSKPEASQMSLAGSSNSAASTSTMKRASTCQSAKDTREMKSRKVVPSEPRYQFSCVLKGVHLAPIFHTHHARLLWSLDLRLEADRLRSFDSWPRYLELCGIDPVELAQSGFFFLGDEGRVQCFSCGWVTRNWALNDVIGAVHEGGSPECRMVRGVESKNVPISSAERLSIRESVINITEEEQREFQKPFPSLSARNLLMTEFSERLRTFDGPWPYKRIRATPEQLCFAGFYYSGKEDYCICFYCGYGVKNWEYNDIPWNEHAKHSQKCEFLLQRKGPDFVRQFQRRKRQQRQRNSSGSNQLRSSQIPQTTEELQRQRNLEFLRAMGSKVVRLALSMGCETKAVKKLVERKLRYKQPMYLDINQLLDDLTQESEMGEMDRSQIYPLSAETTEQAQVHATTSRQFLMTGEPLQSTLPDKIPSPVDTRIREVQDERKCKICYANFSDILFIECGHLISCANCAKDLKICPICKNKITLKIATIP